MAYTPEVTPSLRPATSSSFSGTTRLAGPASQAGSPAGSAAPESSRGPVRPEHLLLQPTHPLPVGPLPRLPSAFRLHLGTVQALDLLLQLQLWLLLCLQGLQPDWALVLLQHHHLGLQERLSVKSVIVCVHVCVIMCVCVCVPDPLALVVCD